MKEIEIKMEGVKEYGENYPVVLTKSDGRMVIRAINEGGHNATEVDFEQLIQWLKINMPEKLEL